MTTIIEEWSPGYGLTAVRCCACGEIQHLRPPRGVQEMESEGYRPVYEDGQQQREGLRIAWICPGCRLGAGPILRNP